MEPTLTAQTDLVSVTPVMKAMPPPDVQKLKTVPIRRRHPAVQASVKTLGLLLVPKTERPITMGAVLPNVLPVTLAKTEAVSEPVRRKPAAATH